MRNLPKVHPRVFTVQAARNDMSSAAIDIQKRYDLTTAEYLSILTELMGSALKYALRAERHPDEPDRPGGVE